MEAGREMDALIAEKVTQRNVGIRVYDNRLPRYSTDISAAWEVADWLRNYWGTFELIAGLSWHCWSELKDAKIWGTGNTAPLAICRAALLAVMEEG